MNIAMISYWACPLTRLGVGTAGGLNVYVLNLAQALGELGQKVDIYTREHPEGADQGVELHPNVNIIHFPQLASDLYQDIAPFVDQIEAYMKQHDLHYDIAHAHYYYSGLVGLQLQERLGIPSVMTFHTLGIMKQQFLGVVDPQRIAAETTIIEHVAGIVASTELEKADLVAWHHVPEDKIHTIHPGVDHHIFRPIERHIARQSVGISDDEKVVLFAGRIDPIKGLHVLLDGFALMLATAGPELQSTKLLVLGGNLNEEASWMTDEAQELRQQIDEQNLADHVIFPGSQPQETLASYYAATDLVVVPSAYESFGFVALEAMACGACVIASRVGGLQYLIQDGDNGRLFESRNIEELATLMRELLEDTAERERLGCNATASSYRYCWSKQAEKMVAVYQSLI